MHDLLLELHAVELVQPLQQVSVGAQELTGFFRPSDYGDVWGRVLGHHGREPPSREGVGVRLGNRWRGDIPINLPIQSLALRHPEPGHYARDDSVFDGVPVQTAPRVNRAWNGKPQVSHLHLP